MSEEEKILKHVERFVDSNLGEKNIGSKFAYADGYTQAFKDIKNIIVFSKQMSGLNDNSCGGKERAVVK